MKLSTIHEFKNSVTFISLVCTNSVNPLSKNSVRHVHSVWINLPYSLHTLLIIWAKDCLETSPSTIRIYFSMAWSSRTFALTKTCQGRSDRDVGEVSERAENTHHTVVLPRRAASAEAPPSSPRRRWSRVDSAASASSWSAEKIRKITKEMVIPGHYVRI